MAGGPVLTLGAVPDAPARARRHLRELGRDWPAELLDTALLLTSELVTNALRHGLGRVTLAVRSTPALVRVEVGDANPRPIAGPPAGPLPGIEAESGRGLPILQALASRWGSAPATNGDGGKSVWFEIDRPDRPAAG